jgi:hypothetical protein
MSTTPEMIQGIQCRGANGMIHKPKRPPVRVFQEFKLAVLKLGGVPARTKAGTWHCSFCQAEHVILAHHLGCASSQAKAG